VLSLAECNDITSKLFFFQNESKVSKVLDHQTTQNHWSPTN
jgi:hypothetical protein